MCIVYYNENTTHKYLWSTTYSHYLGRSSSLPAMYFNLHYSPRHPGTLHASAQKDLILSLRWHPQMYLWPCTSISTITLQLSSSMYEYTVQVHKCTSISHRVIIPRYAYTHVLQSLLQSSLSKCTSILQL